MRKGKESERGTGIRKVIGKAQGNGVSKEMGVCKGKGNERRGKRERAEKGKGKEKVSGLLRRKREKEGKKG